MGFENFGSVSFTTEAKPVDFVTYLEQGKVMTTRCKQCGTAYFPPKADCPKCMQSDVEWFEVAGKGKLLTYTVVNYGPTGFEDDVPYTLALAEFDGGVRIFGRLSRGLKEDDIKLGMDLKVAAVKLTGDRVSFEFQKS